MKTSRALVVALIMMICAAVPSDAQSLVFKDGFELGGTCAWRGLVYDQCNVSTTLIDHSATTGVDGNEAWVMYRIQFMVQNNTSVPIYIEKSNLRSGTPSPNHGITYVIENSSQHPYAGGQDDEWFDSLSYSSGDTGTHYRVHAGQSRSFEFRVRLRNEGGTSGYYAMRFESFTFDLDASWGGSNMFDPVSVSEFSTSLVLVPNANISN